MSRRVFNVFCERTLARTAPTRSVGGGNTVYLAGGGTSDHALCVCGAVVGSLSQHFAAASAAAKHGHSLYHYHMIR